MKIKRSTLRKLIKEEMKKLNESAANKKPFKELEKFEKMIRKEFDKTDFSDEDKEQKRAYDKLLNKIIEDVYNTLRVIFY